MTGRLIYPRWDSTRPPTGLPFCENTFQKAVSAAD
jgi:hypothetical protein